MSEPTTGPQPVTPKPKAKSTRPPRTGDLADTVVPPRRRSSSSNSARSTGAIPVVPPPQSALDLDAIPPAPVVAAPVTRTTRPTTTRPVRSRPLPDLDDPVGQETAAGEPVQPSSTTRGMPRRVRLRITHVSPGTVAQVTFLITAIFAVAGLVTITIIWILLNTSGVLTNSQSLANAIFGTTTTSIDLTKVFSLPRLLLLTAIWGVFQVVVVTFAMWLLAVAYNAIVRLTGGLEVTLADHA